MWRERVDRWQPSSQLRAWVVRREVKSALALIKTAWRSDAHKGAANFLTRKKEEEQVDAACNCRGRPVGISPSPLASTKPKGRARPRSPSLGPAAANGSKHKSPRRRSSSSRRSRHRTQTRKSLDRCLNFRLRLKLRNERPCQVPYSARPLPISEDRRCRHMKLACMEGSCLQQ